MEPHFYTHEFKSLRSLVDVASLAVFTIDFNLNIEALFGILEEVYSYRSSTIIIKQNLETCIDAMTNHLTPSSVHVCVG